MQHTKNQIPCNASTTTTARQQVTHTRRERTTTIPTRPEIKMSTRPAVTRSSDQGSRDQTDTTSAMIYHGMYSSYAKENFVCFDAGMCPIYSAASCAIAASELAVGNGQVESHSKTSKVPGCYINKQNKLRFNELESSTSTTGAMEQLDASLKPKSQSDLTVTYRCK